MSRTTKILIPVLALIVLGASAPFIIRTITLTLAKREFRQIIASWSPSARANADVVPMVITLPPAPASGTAPITISRPGLRVTVPAPLSTQDNAKQPARLPTLVYPHFTVYFFNPRSTVADDAAARKMGFANMFDALLAPELMTPALVEAAPDRETFNSRLALIASKGLGVALTTYDARFDRGDVQGLIRPKNADLREVNAILYWPNSQVGCGLFFISDKGVVPAEILPFLAQLHIDLTLATQPATKP